MGCDIHAMIEVRDLDFKGDLYWINAGDPCIGRDYALFALLANVRNTFGITPISHPRGIPCNATCEMDAWFSANGIDGHSASEATLAEIKAAKENNAGAFPYPPTGIDALIAKMEKAKPEGATDSDVRIVFFFDN